MRTISLVTLSAGFVSLAALGACRGDSNNNTDGNGGDGGAGVKIQDVQNDSMAPGTAVSLHNVVVTAIDNFGTKVGDFWVEEAEGGPFSGVHVYNAPPSQVAMLAVGDVVDITGAVKDEFALMTDTSGRTTTELKPATGGMIAITKNSSGTPPAPQVLDALAIGQMPETARFDEWEKWEGVLVTTSNVAAFGAPVCVGTGCTDATLQKFNITGVAVVESSLAAFPTGIIRNTCLGNVTGVVDYFFDYLILPRSTAEVTTGGASCPPPENSQALCTDTTDNDANGFSDCADNSCIVAYGPGAGTCRVTSTISALRAATPTGGIEVDNAYVVAMSSNKKNIWVQDTTNGTPAPNRGVYIYGPGVDLNTFAVGSKVNIIGTVQEYNNDTMGSTVTELKALDVSAGSAGTVTITPISGLAIATLTTAATGEQYEGVLVRLSNVKVTVLGNSGNFGVGQMQKDGVQFATDDDIFLVTSTVNTCFATIDGIWTYLPYQDAYGFLPLAVGTGTGTCT
jgi:hypothetical protein